MLGLLESRKGLLWFIMHGVVCTVRDSLWAKRDNLTGQKAYCPFSNSCSGKSHAFQGYFFLPQMNVHLQNLNPNWATLTLLWIVVPFSDCAVWSCIAIEMWCLFCLDSCGRIIELPWHEKDDQDLSRLMIFKNMSQNKIATLIFLYASSVISWKSNKASHASVPFLIVFHSWLFSFTNTSCLTLPQFYNHEILMYSLKPSVKTIFIPNNIYCHYNAFTNSSSTWSFFIVFLSVMYMGWCAYSNVITPVGRSEVEAGKRPCAVNWCDTLTPTFFLFLLKSEPGNRWEWSHYFKILAFLYFHFATGHYWCYRYETSLIWFVVSSKTLTHICLLSENRKIGNKFQKPH